MVPRYAFEPAQPAITDYLGQPRTPVRLRLQRPYAPELRWAVVKTAADPNACYASGSVVAQLDLVASNLTASTEVALNLVSDPPGALGLDRTNLTLPAPSGSNLVKVIAGNPDAVCASATVTLRAGRSGDCPLRVSPSRQMLSACFISPQINWHVIAPFDAARRFAPGEMVAEVILTPTNFAAPAEVVAELGSEPSGALGFGTNVSRTTLTLNPGSPSLVLKVFAGNADTAEAKAVVRLQARAASGRPVQVLPARETISARFVQSAKLEWIAAGGERIPAPSEVRLRATKDTNGVWNYERPPAGEPTEQFVLTLPQSGDEQNSFQISIEAGELKYAVDLQEEGQQEPGLSRRKRVSTKGTHVFRLATKRTEGSRYYRGKVEVIPAASQLLNGTNEPVVVPIEVYLTPPPKTN